MATAGIQDMWSSSCLCHDKTSPGLNVLALVRTTQTIISLEYCGYYSRAVWKGPHSMRGQEGQTLSASREMGEGEVCPALPPMATSLRGALQWQHEKAGAKGNGAAASMLKTEPKGLAPS